MDFSREERTEEIFNFEKQIARSEETLSEERENGGNRVGGAAGDNAAQGVVRVGDASSSSRERVATNYEIDKVTKHIRGPMAKLERISVAVVINSNYKGKQEDENAVATVSDEELDNFKKLIQNAVGYNKDRGDVVDIVAQPFQEATLDVKEVLSAQQTQNLINDSIQWGIILLIAAFVFFIAYKLMQYLTGTPEDAEILQDGQLPPGEDQLALPGAELLDELDEDEGPLIEKIRDYVKRNPDKASAVIRYWLSPVEEE
jgi:flagellar M-ring protein FliF